MAQGAIKQKKGAAPAKSRPSTLGPRKGAKVIKTKNQKLAQQQKAAKKLSAGLTAKTERALAERAGHLELLAGGKKSNKGSSSSSAATGGGSKVASKGKATMPKGKK